MIKLNVTRAKEIKFGVEVAGVEMRDLKGAVRIVHEGVEYGFPISIIDDNITVSIPPLDNIIKTELKENTPLEAKLDIIADDVHSTPWADTIRIERPVSITTTIKEVEDIHEKEKIDIKAKLIAELDGPKAKKKVSKTNEAVKKVVKKDPPKWLK